MKSNTTGPRVPQVGDDATALKILADKTHAAMETMFAAMTQASIAAATYHAAALAQPCTDPKICAVPACVMGTAHEYAASAVRAMLADHGSPLQLNYKELLLGAAGVTYTAARIKAGKLAVK